MDNMVCHTETLRVLTPFDGKTLDDIKEVEVIVRKWKQN
jgi:hypothetical protein